MRWIESADRALYAAKGRGRDQVCLATEVRAPATRSGESETRDARPRRRVRDRAASGRGREAHAEAVAALAGLIAEHLGLPAGSSLRCRLGGWLHDVGKAAIPHAILDAPGPLNADEWTRHAHPPGPSARRSSRGSPASATPPPPSATTTSATTAPATPTGSPGRDIPIEARIVAAADAYCAMTTDRVYSVSQDARGGGRRAGPQRRHAPRPRRRTRAPRRDPAPGGAGARGEPARDSRAPPRGLPRVGRRHAPVDVEHVARALARAGGGGEVQDGLGDVLREDVDAAAWSAGGSAPRARRARSRRRRRAPRAMTSPRSASPGAPRRG